MAKCDLHRHYEWLSLDKSINSPLERLVVYTHSMTTYAIGDIQGCYDQLQRLLDDIQFDPAADKLYFVGDLVNRGPQSLSTLRFVKQLGKAAVTVLGNHDLHLIAVALSLQQQKSGDTLNDILHANDCEELIAWLCQLPLLYHDKNLQCTIVHAGILPQWSLAQAQQYAAEIEHVLQSEQRGELIRNMYGNLPNVWSDTLTGIERWRFIINVFTRMRYVTQSGALDLRAKMAVADAPADLIPWYDYSPRVMANEKIIFGHWAALQGITNNTYAINLDAGCVWGNALTAILLSH